MVEILTLSNPMCSGLLFYGTICVLKMMALALRTTMLRLNILVFANPEDMNLGEKSKLTFTDPDVERVRRNHLNDLENIPAFILVGLFYTLTQPSSAVALWHFRVFTVARILHTVSYQLAIPQPARAVCFITGVLTTLSMAAQTLMAVF